MTDDKWEVTYRLENCGWYLLDNNKKNNQERLKMTDKQIIIDSVDITNCIHRATNKLCGDIDPYCRCYTGSCNDISNCYYKQLKRKEQECERLKEERDSWHYQWEKRYEICESLSDVIDELRGQLDQLKAENDTLKQYKASKQASYESMQREWNQAVNENRELKSDNKHLNGLLNQALKELEEHREALEKVREVCTKYKEICANCEGDEYIDCVDCTEGGEAQVAIKVLQICDEVNDVY